MEEQKKNKTTHCDAEAQTKVTKKLSECDKENENVKNRSECYDRVIQEEKDKDGGACINS